MRKSRFTEAQIIQALRQAEADTPVAEICRSLQITEQSFYRWKRKYGSLGTPEIRELRQLREENKKLKQLVADLTLDKHILQESLKISSKAPGAAPVGRLGEVCIPDIGSPGVPCERVLEIEHPVQVPAAPAGRVKETSERAGGSSHELRVPSAACAAEA
jgi:putative transposase